MRVKSPRQQTMRNSFASTTHNAAMAAGLTYGIRDAGLGYPTESMATDLGARVGIFAETPKHSLYRFSKCNVRSAEQASYVGHTCRVVGLHQITGLPQSCAPLCRPAAVSLPFGPLRHPRALLHLSTQPPNHERRCQRSLHRHADAVIRR